MRRTTPSIAGAVEEFIAHTEQSVASALKAVGLDHPRAATRAGIVLEEVLDLVVDGDIPGGGRAHRGPRGAARCARVR
jgi:hypothetical protein